MWKQPLLKLQNQKLQTATEMLLKLEYTAALSPKLLIDVGWVPIDGEWWFVCVCVCVYISLSSTHMSSLDWTDALALCLSQHRL